MQTTANSPKKTVIKVIKQETLKIIVKPIPITKPFTMAGKIKAMQGLFLKTRIKKNKT